MPNWWETAYADIVNWKPSAAQDNPDKGAYKDAFQMRMAEKGRDYEMSQALMNQATQQEKELMQSSADLDRRNTLDIMTGEHEMKLEGMKYAHGYSTDFLRSEGEEQRKGIVTTGEQERLNIGARGTEDRRTLETQGDIARRNLVHDREHAASLSTRMARR